MGRPVINLSGQTFGRLTVLNQEGFFGKNAAWRCICSCGNTALAPGGRLQSKGVQSCGCLASETHSAQLSARNTTHGKSRSRVYGIWQSMISRCTRPSHAHFKHYGGRGIKVCAEWQPPHGFPAFLKCMGEPLDHMTLDRKDNSGNYEPGNCQWATLVDQANNTRRIKRYEWQGKQLQPAELAEIAGVKLATMYWRLAHWGMPTAVLGQPES